MKIDSDAKECIEAIHLIAGVKKDDVQKIFESLAIYMILNYLNNDKISIPYIGECSLKYEGDEIEKNKLKAIVKCEFDLNDFILKNIGQVKDQDTTEIEKILKRRIRNTLSEYLDT